MKKRFRCVDDPGILELAEELKVISDPNRLRILCMLLWGERCVCEVEREMGISQQLASHHLNVLKERGLLRARREGTSSYYSVDTDRLERLTGLFTRCLGHRAGEAEGEPACCASTPNRARAGAGGRERGRGGRG